MRGLHLQDAPQTPVESEGEALTHHRRQSYAVLRSVLPPAFAVLGVVAAIWLLMGRPIPGQSEPAQTVLVAAQGGEYVAVEVGSLSGAGGPLIGEPAPDFVLPDLDGGVIQLSDLRGKVVLVNLWATWCVPCRAEIPGLIRMYEQYRDRGFEVLAVDYQESPDEVRQFVDDWGMTYLNVIDGDASVVRQYRLTGIPESFFVDRNGMLRDLRIGQMEESFVACVVEALLDDSRAASYEPGECS